MLLVGPIARTEQSSSMDILDLEHYPAVTYQNAVLVIVNNYFQKTISEIAQKINNDFIYVFGARSVEYSHLLLSLYLLIPKLQASTKSKGRPASELDKNIIHYINQILEKEVVIEEVKEDYEDEDYDDDYTEGSKLSINPYPQSTPYYKLRPPIALLHREDGAYNPMRILTGYQDVSIDENTERALPRSIIKYRSKSRLQNIHKLTAYHKHELGTSLLHSVNSTLLSLYPYTVVKISFWGAEENYFYNDEYSNYNYNFSVDFTSFMELYRKEPIHYYGIIEVQSGNYFTWSELAIDRSFLWVILYKIIFELADRLSDAEQLERIYQGVSSDKSEIFAIILNAFKMEYWRHLTMFYTYEIRYCCENYRYVNKVINQQDLIIHMKIEVNNRLWPFYILISSYKYQRMFHEARGRVRFIRDFLLLAMQDSHTKVKYKIDDFGVRYVVIS